MLCSLFTKDFMVIMLFLYFIVLFTNYLHFNFYACKKDTNISNWHETKTNIAIYKSFGKVKINTYTNSMQTFKTLPLLKVEP